MTTRTVLLDENFAALGRRARNRRRRNSELDERNA
jgi:hypothetical protein